MESEHSTQEPIIRKDRRNARQAALKVFLETQVTSETHSTLDWILDKFNKSNPNLSRATLGRDLKDIHYEKVDGVYKYVEPPDEKTARQEEVRKDHRELLKSFVKTVYQCDVFWIPLEVQPGYAEGVAASLKQVYPKKIFASVAVDDVVLVSFLSKSQRDFVQDDLHKLTGSLETKPKSEVFKNGDLKQP